MAGALRLTVAELLGEGEGGGAGPSGGGGQQGNPILPPEAQEADMCVSKGV